MPYAPDAEHTMLGALTISHVGLYKLGTAVTGWTSTGSILKSASAHGLVDKDLVYINSATGGAAGAGANGLIPERIYWVKKVSTTEIELFPLYALTGVAEKYNTAVTEASISKLEEAAGGSPEYKRIAITAAAAANRKRIDSTEREINVASGQVVDFIGYFSAETGADKIVGVSKQTKETFGAQGIYKVKESVLDLTFAP